MVKLSALIDQIHHRSIWQVSLVYVGGAWAMLDRIDMAETRFGLPGWVFDAAMIVLVVGLLAVLVIASWPKMQRRRTPQTTPSDEIRPERIRPVEPPAEEVLGDDIRLGPTGQQPKIQRRLEYGEPGAPASPHVFMPRLWPPARNAILASLACFVFIFMTLELVPSSMLAVTWLVMLALWPTAMTLAFVLTYRREIRAEPDS